jgi:hypothetical protein
MRWYCVWRFAASDLKETTLRLLSASVTYTPTFRNANSAGDGKKSVMTSTSPMGSWVSIWMQALTGRLAGNVHDIAAIVRRDTGREEKL